VDEYELIVVGGGVFGLSVAWEAGRRGRRTLLVERRSVPNPIAASFGPSRKIRSTYLDPHYARLAHEAMAGWRAIEAAVGEELYLAVGNLAFTTLEEQPHLDRLEAVARETGSAVRVLGEREMQAEFPQLRGARRGLLETSAGFLRATACVEALRGLAERSGVTFATETEVERIEPNGRGLEVRGGQAAWRADQVVLAGGGWSGRLLPELGRSLWQCPQGILYLEGVPAELGRPSFVPFSCADNGFYGFPAEPGVGLKVAEHILGAATDNPDFDRATVPAGFRERAAAFLRQYFGLDASAYRSRVESCMYNLSRSNDFLLDFHPDRPGLFVATAGSGHGFKFGSIMGSIVLDRLAGLASEQWSPSFSWRSFVSGAAAARPM
jgi:glycine/D-amino acid oxidase-like deaminating enzyme